MLSPLSESSCITDAASDQDRRGSKLNMKVQISFVKIFLMHILIYILIYSNIFSRLNNSSIIKLNYTTNVMVPKKIPKRRIEEMSKSARSSVVEHVFNGRLTHITE